MPNIDDQNILDLINLAKDDTEIKETPKKQKEAEVELFFKVKELISGDTRIPVHVIYTFYLEFSKNPVSTKVFTRLLRKKYPVRLNNNILYAKLDPKALKIPINYDALKDPNQIFRSNLQLIQSKFLGVYQLPNGTYIAKLLLPDGNYIPCGRYRLEREAALAYDKAALQIYGTDALLNFKATWKELLDGSKEFPIRNYEANKAYKKIIKETVEAYFKKQKQNSEQR